MKKLLALIITSLMLFAVAGAETADVYTTASTTKTVLTGDALAEAEAVLVAQSSLLSMRQPASVSVA